MSPKVPVQDPTRTGQSFAAAGVPGSRLEGLPDANAFFQHNTAGVKGQSHFSQGNPILQLDPERKPSPLGGGGKVARSAG